MKKKAKILFIAMPFSIHTARWIEQLRNSKWEVHLFPSMDFQPLHTTIKGIVYHEPFYHNLYGRVDGNRYEAGLLGKIPILRNSFVKRLFRLICGFRSQEARLRATIRKLKPITIHSLESQHAGYLVSKVKAVSNDFPFWIHSTWGIDLHFFGKLEGHREMLKQLLSGIDLLIVEGQRDENFARDLGYTKEVSQFASVGGGFQIQTRNTVLPSIRKKILVKGTQDVIRRGLVALYAIERCHDILGSFEILIHSADDSVKVNAELVGQNVGLNIVVLNKLSHQEFLKLNEESRISICINMSDGVPNSMLEAMLSGAFPIQSNTAITSDWIENGKTGFVVSPQDAANIEEAIRRAVLDDQLVDSAARVNKVRVEGELNYAKVRKKALLLYEHGIQKSQKEQSIDLA